MKLLLYSLNFAPELTGIGKYSGEMAVWLARHGHQVEVVCATPYYPEWRVHPGHSAWRWRRESVSASGSGVSAGSDADAPAGAGAAGSLRVTRCPLWVPARPSGAKRLLHLASFALSSLPALLRGLMSRPDLVFVVAPALMVAPQALVLARLSGRPAWLHVQDFEVDAALDMGIVRPGLLGRAARWLEARLLRRFDRVSTLSAAMAQRLHDKGVSAERVALLPNWADLQGIRPRATAFPAIPANPVRAELGLGADDVLLLYAGNMGEKQGLDIVIDVARALQAHPSIRVLMVGTGAARQRLVQRAQGLGNVTWWPLQPPARLGALLDAADIHLLPQRADVADLVMPSKLGGMLASGRMVIGTARANTEVGRLLDVVGVRTEPGDADALAAAVLRYAEHPAERLRLGASGRRHAARALDIDVLMPQFLAQAQALTAACSRQPSTT